MCKKFHIFSPSVIAGPKTLDEMEFQMITKALEDFDGNYSAAAEQLGVSRQTLYNKMKRLKADG